MSEMRERLIELLMKVDYALDVNGRKARDSAEFIADFLLSNSVIALPCSVDHSELFAIVDLYNRKKVVGQAVAKYAVDCIIIGYSQKLIYRCCNASNEWVDFDGEEIGKTVFLTREEAEVTLKRLREDN